MIDADNYYSRIPGFPEDLPMADAIRVHFWSRVDAACRPPKKAKPDKDGTIQPIAQRGRWLALCPNFESCGVAIFASRTDPRFFCLECLNATFGGRWLEVRWPRTIKAINRALNARPLPASRNWRGESPATLWRENEEHGIKRGGR